MASIWIIAWLLCALAVTWAAIQDVGLATQAWLGLCGIGALLLLRVFKFGGVIRAFVLLLAAFMTVRYLGWRTFYSLPPYDSSGFVPGLVLYLAELHAISLYSSGSSPTSRRCGASPPGCRGRSRTSRAWTC